MVRLPGLRKATERRPLRVLLVEDSENDALLLLRELRRGGYEPLYERVQTPEAMKEALGGSEWDVIISDYHLPRFGAPEALAISREAGLETPFVVVSGKVGEEAAVEALKAGAHDYVMKGNLTRLCATVERGMEETQQRRRHNAILDAVRFAAEHFLGNPSGWEENVRSVLHRLGETAGVSRVYIFENYEGEDGQVWATQRYEWVAPGVSAQIDNPVLKALPYRGAGFARWEKELGRGNPVYGNTAYFPESERPEMRAEEILSIVVVPIFVEGRWWGFLGFDDCSREREWSVAEIDALKAATSTLGAALQRQIMEEDLRGSEERYRAVIEQATDGIYLLDADTRRILQTNPSFEKMLGYAEDEMRGMEVYDIVAHPRENVDATIDRTLRERRRVVGGRRYRRKDGSALEVEVGVSVIAHDDREVICTIVRDVTERRKNEEALRQSEERYRAVVEQSTDGIYLVDGETRRILETNPALQNMLGYSAEELLGMELHEIVAHELESVYANIERTLKEGWRFIRERRYRRKDGSVVDVEVAASAIHYGGKQVICAAIRDITERKRAEEALREIRQAERRRIARDLHDGVLQDLSYTTAAMGLILLDAEGTGLEAELQRAIDAVRRAAQGLRAAVNDLRLGEEGDRPFAELIQFLVERNRTRAQGYEIRLEVEEGLPATPPGNAGTEVLRVIQEALTNARRHSGARDIRVSVRMEGEELVAEVADDGRGFEPGTPSGVGLDSMQERAAALGGNLEIESRVGHGTRVRLRVPIPQKG